MKYAIVESGGKQYRVAEGDILDVDRLPVNPGERITLARVLLLAEDDHYWIGTPWVDGIAAQASVIEHIRGEKVLAFRYRPKKRIRVRRGHRQHYTRLKVEFIGPMAEMVARAEEAPEVTQPAAGAQEADDLTRIEGIGPKVAEALQAAGIQTFAQLAEADVESVRQILTQAGLKMMNPEGWIEQAQLAAQGDWQGFEALQAELKGGRRARPAKKEA